MLRRQIGTRLVVGALGSMVLAAPVAARASEDALVNGSEVSRAKQARPAALVPLYISAGILQVLDTHSTLRAIDRGGQEANPLLRGSVGQPIALAAVKMGGTAAMIVFTERIWKKHPVAAIVMLVAVNSAYTAIAAHNYLHSPPGRSVVRHRQ